VSLFGFLDPHFELLWIGTLEKGGHLGRKIGIGAPRGVNLLREHKLRIVRLSQHEFHDALLLVVVVMTTNQLCRPSMALFGCAAAALGAVTLGVLTAMSA
jgi:hypothetical protein